MTATSGDAGTKRAAGLVQRRAQRPEWHSQGGWEVEEKAVSEVRMTKDLKLLWLC